MTSCRTPGTCGTCRRTSTSWCGDYRRAIASNSDAIRVDEKYRQRGGAMNFYTLYRSHDFHFRIYAAMFAGQSAVALATASQLEASIPEELLRVESPPMADWLEGFLAMRVHALIRFGRWEDVLRAAAARGPGVALRHDGDDPLRARGRVRGDRTGARGGVVTVAVP